MFTLLLSRKELILLQKLVNAERQHPTFDDEVPTLTQIAERISIVMICVVAECVLYHKGDHAQEDA